MTIYDFDEEVIAPLSGYSGRDEYYDAVSCGNNINKIRIPCFFLNALDDPIIPVESIDYDAID